VSELDILVSRAKTAEPIEIHTAWAADLCGPKEPFVRQRCTLMPPCEYD